jgi:hypothetical protein
MDAKPVNYEVPYEPEQSESNPGCRTRLFAGHASSATRRARRIDLEAKADSLVAEIYPTILAAAEQGLGHVNVIFPIDMSTELRGAVVTSLLIDGYKVSDSPTGMLISWFADAASP